MDFSTLCIHGATKKFDNTGTISVPLFQTATFAHPAVGESTGYDYSRQQNPTREHLETVMAKLEGGVDAIAFSSGMAAITTVMDLFSPGDHFVASDDLYGGTHRLFFQMLVQRGMSFTLVDTADLVAVTASIRENTKAIFVETPTNPMMHVSDIRAIAKIAKVHSLITIVDNTFLTPYLQRPLELGADICVHSGTKYLCGHNDIIAGFAVTNSPAIADRLRFLFKTTGACLSVFDSWLMIRSLKTLPLRLEHQQKTAMQLALWLKEQPEITAVHYPGLPDHPQYQISQQQASGFGAMLSLETKTSDMAKKLLEHVKLMQYAESLGGAETLITYPMLQTHGDIPEAERIEKGITDRLLRLSVGFEHLDDLIADFTQALHA